MLCKMLGLLSLYLKAAPRLSLQGSVNSRIVFVGLASYQLLNLLQSHVLYRGALLPSRVQRKWACINSVLSLVGPSAWGTLPREATILVASGSVEWLFVVNIISCFPPIFFFFSGLNAGS